MNTSLQTFTRRRTLDELKIECQKENWPLHTEKFDAGSDYVSVDFTHKDTEGTHKGRMLINMFNGQFFGTIQNPKGIKTEFQSQNNKHDGEPWFDKLLNLTYIK